MRQRTILLQAEAPPKPPEGAACNGCGVCCAWAPCPLGVLLSRRWRGRCAALRWAPAERRYRCGALLAAGRHRPRLTRLPTRLAQRLLARMIGAARGCDAALTPG